MKTKQQHLNSQINNYKEIIIMKKLLTLLTILASTVAYPMLKRSCHSQSNLMINPNARQQAIQEVTYKQILHNVRPLLPDSPNGSPRFEENNQIALITLTPTASEQHLQNNSSFNDDDVIENGETDLIRTVTVDDETFEEITEAATFIDPKNIDATDYEIIRMKIKLKQDATHLAQNVTETARAAGKINDTFSAGANQSWFTTFTNKCSAGIKTIKFITTAKGCGKSAKELLVDAKAFMPILMQKFQHEFRGDNNQSNN